MNDCHLNVSPVTILILILMDWGGMDWNGEEFYSVKVKGFIAVRRPFSLNAEFSEMSWHIANRCCTWSFLIYLNKLLPSNFHKVWSLISSFFQTWILYQALMQSRSFDYPVHSLFYTMPNTDLFLAMDTQTMWAPSREFVFSSILSWLRMPSHSEGPGIWLSVWRFLLTHCSHRR